jgi:hypothetical protein
MTFTADGGTVSSTAEVPSSTATAPRTLVNGSGNNNTMHGKGTCEYNDGTVYTGGFNHNKFHGVGHLKMTNGQEHFGIWDNHNLVQRFDQQDPTVYKYVARTM